MIFKKPMLLSNDEFELTDIDYTNKRISVKRDGVRAETTNEGIKNRSLKILRNVKIQEYFREVYENLPDGVVLEAEIYCDGIPCREMAGICNSKDKDVPEGTKLYFFGMFSSTLDFEDRLMLLNTITNKLCEGNNWEVVQQHTVKSAEEAQAFYDDCISKGYEGAVIMDGNSKYKQGRITIKRGIGYKIKPHSTIDLPIIGVTERMLNTNESQKNELGESYKRNTVDSKESTGIAACFVCKMDNGMETKVTITGEELFRREIWQNKESYIGQYAVVKSMNYGTKDRLRHPRLIDIKLSVEK